MLAQSLGERPTWMPDWCGVREVWISGSATDPCTELAQDLAQLRAEVTGWKAPLEFLRTFSRWQFLVGFETEILEFFPSAFGMVDKHLTFRGYFKKSASTPNGRFQIAPNISRLESLTEILEQAQACTIGSSWERTNFSVELHGVAADDRASLEEEHCWGPGGMVHLP